MAAVIFQSNHLIEVIIISKTLKYEKNIFNSFVFYDIIRLQKRKILC